MTDISPPYGNYTGVKSPDTSPRYKSGQWFSTQDRGAGIGNNSFPAGRITTVPVWIESDITIDSLSIYLGAMSVSSVGYIGIYSSKDFVPDILLGIVGPIDLGVVGITSGAFQGGPLFIRRGWYFFGVQVDNTVTTLNATSGKNLIASLLGQVSPGNNHRLSYVRDTATGVFPSPFLGGQSGFVDPVVQFRIA